MAVKYKGNGAFILGIPAKDLTDEEIKGLGVNQSWLLETGIYEEIKGRPLYVIAFQCNLSKNPVNEVVSNTYRPEIEQEKTEYDSIS